ncbi:TrmH family RNA methyltransferase [Candidatus Saccharibacteria bacterium]|nr:TrmH family RNA methyltransferase [Candidatus Saccharibacteria bacterium]
MKEIKLVLILSDVRSCYNVGSIFRTADASGVSEVVCCGITPYPRLANDRRPEKIIANNTKMIHKTALDAENSVKYSHFDSVIDVINQYKKLDFEIIALENKVPNTQNIFQFKSIRKNIVLVLGSETSGLDNSILKLCSSTVEIPMRGIKNSLNVSVATGIALYALLDQ